jgi:hypothetical protein
LQLGSVAVATGVTREFTAFHNEMPSSILLCDLQIIQTAYNLY